MKSFVVGLVFVVLVVLGPACFEFTCKNPLRGAPNAEAGAREGVLVQCNVVLTCAKPGEGDKRRALVGVEDAQIIDRRSNMLNEDACIERAKDLGISGKCKILEVNPKVICLDPPGSNGCGTPGDGTVIIVGSAASGDFRSDPHGVGGIENYGVGDGAGVRAECKKFPRKTFIPCAPCGQAASTIACRRAPSNSVPPPWYGNCRMLSIPQDPTWTNRTKGYTRRSP